MGTLKDPAFLKGNNGASLSVSKRKTYWLQVMKFKDLWEDPYIQWREKTMDYKQGHTGGKKKDSKRPETKLLIPCASG